MPTFLGAQKSHSTTFYDSPIWGDIMFPSKVAGFKRKIANSSRHGILPRIVD